MATLIRHQKLPSSGPEREILREKGQFWTPDWVAEAMVAYALGNDSNAIFDPAVGAGAFLNAAKNISTAIKRTIRLSGTEIDCNVLEKARQNGLSENDLKHVIITDFVLSPPKNSYKAIVANPPYIRHHRLSDPVKEKLRYLGIQAIGSPLDGRAGYHIYFLIRALQLLEEGGRLCFIMPADTCEGVFSQKLWNWISCHYRLEAVVTFASDASPFPGVDTNPIIFMIQKSAPAKEFLWVKCLEANSLDLRDWVLSGFRKNRFSSLNIFDRQLSEGISTGLSRAPLEDNVQGPKLGDFAKILRGIATGANEFFFMTKAQAAELGIPKNFFVTAVGRTRDVPEDEIGNELIEKLETLGRPTQLLSLNGLPFEQLPKKVQDYLGKGEEIGLPQRPLIASRRPWYKMEVRQPPPFMFSYLGRRNSRFIRNRSNIIPLTGFLCVYPLDMSTEFVEKLWKVLQDERTIANLQLVGKSYGSGAIKVEPRALERLPIPSSVLTEIDLHQPCQLAEQLEMVTS